MSLLGLGVGAVAGRLAFGPSPVGATTSATFIWSAIAFAVGLTCEPEDGGAKELQRFIDANQHRVAYDAVDAPTVLVEYAPELRAIEANWPKIRFHALREHAGLVFQKQLEG